MSLRYGLRSAADLFAKLRRDSAALEAEVSSDLTFNFVVTAYHLKEWIASDPSIEVDPTKLERIARSKWFQACRDLANASKHFELDPRRNPDPTQSAESEKGYGVGRSGVGAFGHGEEAISIELKSGETVTVLQLVQEIMALYQSFFEEGDVRSR